MIEARQFRTSPSVYNFNVTILDLIRRRLERPRLDAFMPTILIDRRCPRCQATDARLQPFNSFLSHVDYFRCPKCGHAWNEPKAGDTSRPKTTDSAPAS